MHIAFTIPIWIFWVLGGVGIAFIIYLISVVFFMGKIINSVIRGLNW